MSGNKSYTKMNFYLKITFKKALHSVRKIQSQVNCSKQGGKIVCIVGGEERERNSTAEIQASFLACFKKS